MKPLKLKIQAFGPYVQMQTVDFKKLSEMGIFLIKGPTGSGKTAIFDAMTFALYGGSSGDDSKSKVGRNALEEWRCNQADNKLPTIVSFLFSVRGRTYEFTRKLVYGRSRFSEEYAAAEIDEDGIAHPLFENPKKDALNKEAERLIGLTKEQFRQVVLLPQGQFERFLIASSEEKEIILEKIFDSQRWDTYAQNFFDDADQRKKLLDAEKSDILRSLKDEGLMTLPELEERLADKTAQKEENEKARAEFNFKARQEQLNADYDLAARFDILDELEKKYTALQNQAAEIDEKREALKRAAAAEGLRNVLLEEEHAGKAYNQREQALKEVQRRLPAAQKASEAAENALSAHEAASPVPELQKKHGAYSSKQETYEHLETLQQAQREAAAFLNKEKGAAEKAEAKLQSAAEEMLQASSRYSKAQDDERNLRERYNADICGKLAAELKEDSPCPVCGSCHHPNPAQQAADSVSKADVDKAGTAIEAAKRAWEQLEVERSRAENAKKEADQRVSEASRAFTEASTRLDAAKSQLVDGIPTLEALKKALRQLEQNIQAYTKKTESLKKTADEAKENQNTLRANLASAEKELRSAEADWIAAKQALSAALAESSYADAESVKADLRTEKERSELQKAISTYDGRLQTTRSDLEKNQQTLSGVEAPDKSQFKARQDEIHSKERDFQKNAASLEGEITRLQRKQKELSQKQAHYDANYQQAEDDLIFARKLRGDTDTGLQRYVLAVLLSQVTAEANRMLSKVHGGRYRLYRSDEKGKGNKRGLELKVYDNRSPETAGRSVAMLSGGEKFLVSLALSIGLSTVAQKGGVQIEALFIDEGFGTLDDSSIHDAMDVLESVRRSSGMIGIISHVQLLEENIPTHLEVVKSESGSSIRPV